MRKSQTLRFVKRRSSAPFISVDVALYQLWQDAIFSNLIDKGCVLTYIRERWRGGGIAKFTLIVHGNALIIQSSTQEHHCSISPKSTQNYVTLSLRIPLNPTKDAFKLLPFVS